MIISPHALGVRLSQVAEPDSANVAAFEEAIGSLLTAAPVQIDIGHELQLARSIQESFLPINFPPLQSFDLAGFCRNAHQVGGDFYDVLPVASDSLLLLVADVMGKGIPAALFAATLRALIRSLAEWTHSPAELLARANRLMFQDLSRVDMFVTAQVALLETSARRLTIASAGHCPLLVADALGEIKALSPDGIPIGIDANAAFKEQSLLLTTGGCALLYSDGVTEAQNPMGEFFGQAGLEQLLLEAVGQTQSAASVKENLLSMLTLFQAGTQPRDDQTFLVLAG
ncbi:MAG TPA: PP2C family protein-serine/threonine phosphatase [Verrucomicrobiae bacterium]|nr:PP2C family protein-serine/threonine phosphatase [Verrucomicrobiae bacterium]